MLRRTTLLAAAAGMAMTQAARASDYDWNDPTGGFFNSAANWTPATIPGTTDRAIFDLSSQYTVTFFAFSRTNSRLRIGDDNVAFNLGGNTYSLSSTNNASVSIGGGLDHGSLGDVGALTLTSGAAATFNSVTTEIGGALGTLGSGAMTVASNVTWNSSGVISVGSSASGSLTVQGGGDIIGFMGIIGDARTGTATVTGGGSTWINSASLDLASNANGTLNIQGGGLVRNDETIAGAGAGRTGTINVIGAPSRWENLGALILGYGGVGNLTVSGGGYASTISLGGYDSLGENSGSSGSLTVTGFPSEFRNTNGDLYVGKAGTGTLSIQAGGLCIPGRSVYVGATALGSGTVLLDGFNSRLVPSQGVFVGGTSGTAGGPGTLTVNTGSQVAIGASFDLTIWPTGTVNLAGGTIQLGTLVKNGVFNWTSGTLRFLTRLNIKTTGPLGPNVAIATGKILDGVGVEIDGAAPATLSVPGGALYSGADFMVGNTGSGALGLTDGAYGSCLSFTIGNAASAVGAITLDGADTQMDVGQFGLLNDVYVGNFGTGALNISNGARMFTAYNPFEIGEQAGSHGSVTVSGAASTLDTGTFYRLDIGRYGQGTLNVLAGGRVDAPATMADQAGSSSAATVSGTGSIWSSPGLIVGNASAATITVQSGGSLQVGDLYSAMFPGSSAQVLITGVASSITATPDGSSFGQINLGGAGTASLTVEQGAHASCVESFVGDGSPSTGTLTIRGAGSQFSASEELDVSFSGHGVLLVQSAATVSTGYFRVGTHAQGVGEATIDGPGSMLTAANSVSVGGGASGRLTISNGAAVQSSGPAWVSSGGLIELAGGSFTSTSLSVSGTLSGAGTVNANVVNAGSVSPGNSPGILSVQGAYSQTGDLNIEVGGATAGAGYDRLAISGPVNLAGALHVSLVDGYSPRRGDTYTILTASSVAGTFSTVNLPQLTGGSLRVVYAPTSVSLVYCYANCDRSTVAPILNVIDFACFLNQFAAGDAYANCDGSTTPPELNVLDFTCFLNAFAAGCP